MEHGAHRMCHEDTESLRSREQTTIQSSYTRYPHIIYYKYIPIIIPIVPIIYDKSMCEPRFTSKSLSSNARTTNEPLGEKKKKHLYPRNTGILFRRPSTGSSRSIARRIVGYCVILRFVNRCAVAIPPRHTDTYRFRS